MPYRTFMDSTGAEWSAWEVTPGGTERRICERRRLAEPTEEERRERERRIALGEPAQLYSTFAVSWLCFEGVSERRRLMQVPAGWAELTDEELARYRDLARPVPATALRYTRDGLPVK